MNTAKIAAGVCLVAAFSVSTSVIAQPVRVTIPGTAFTVVSGQAAVQDVAGGRSIRGKAFSLVTLAANIRMPASSAAAPKMQRLVLHFRTSPSGPSLRAVALRNGSASVFRIQTELRGDYVTREITTPEVAANVWDWSRAPIAVSAQSVLRLEVQFPGGFDSQIDPGELVLAGATVDFPRVAISPEDGLRTPPSRVFERGAAGVIYAVNAENELLWYRHDGRDDGSFRWAAPLPKTVGSGWDVRQVFSGGDGAMYAVMANGDLLWNRHEGRTDGTFRWASPQSRKIGSGWNFEHVFSGGGGVIYAITTSGDLLWYRHDGRTDGTVRWAFAEPKKVGTGWSFAHVFSGGDGVIYAVTAGGDLLWYRHDGHDDGTSRWAAPSGNQVGSGWNVRQAFSGGDGVVYAVMPNGDLLWNRHDGRTDGTFRWAAPNGKKVGSGWIFAAIF